MVPDTFRTAVNLQIRISGKYILQSLLFLHLLLYSSLAASKPDCSGLVDSMVAIGTRYLGAGKLDSASQFLTAAHKCGMSLDSMKYFAAEIFLAEGAIDTAIIFNIALERERKIDRKLYLDQRYRIFKKLHLYRAADSIRALYSPSGRHDIILNSNGNRSGLAVSGLSFMPQRFKLGSPPDDTDDIGGGGITYRWSCWNVGKIQKLTISFDFQSDFPIPTKYSSNDIYDTLMRVVGGSIQLGEYTKTPEFRIGYRLRFHTLTDNTYHVVRTSLSKTIGKSRMIAGSNETGFIRGERIPNSFSELQFSVIRKRKRISGIFTSGGSYNFSRSNIYQNRLDTAGVFRPLQLGFVDSLKNGERYRYFTDNSMKTQYIYPGLPDIHPYWANQPFIQMIQHVTEHSINLDLRSSLLYSHPKIFNIRCQAGVQFLYYLDKASWWYAIDTTMVFKSPFLVNSRYTVIYDTENGKHYLHTNPYSLDCAQSELRELKLCEKRRADCYISLGLNIERNFKYIGKLFLAGSYVKAFSTLDDNSPIVRLRYGWQITGGWSREFFLVKR